MLSYVFLQYSLVQYNLQCCISFSFHVQGYLVLNLKTDMMKKIPDEGFPLNISFSRLLFACLHPHSNSNEWYLLNFYGSQGSLFYVILLYIFPCLALPSRYVNLVHVLTFLGFMTLCAEE